MGAQALRRRRRGRRPPRRAARDRLARAASPPAARLRPQLHREGCATAWPAHRRRPGRCFLICRGASARARSRSGPCLRNILPKAATASPCTIPATPRRRSFFIRANHSLRRCAKPLSRAFPLTRSAARVFIDPTAAAPYLFHLALIGIVRKADPELRRFALRRADRVPPRRSQAGRIRPDRGMPDRASAAPEGRSRRHSARRSSLRQSRPDDIRSRRRLRPRSNRPPARRAPSLRDARESARARTLHRSRLPLRGGQPARAARDDRESGARRRRAKPRPSSTESRRVNVLSKT